MVTDRQYRLARIWSNEELRRIAPLFQGLVVNVSAGTDEDKEGATYKDYFVRAEAYELTNYSPGAYRGFSGRTNEHLFDLREETPPALARRYDVAFNHTTLEHVFDACTAFSNICALSKDVVIVVVPFAQVQHETSGYEDFWRFTPTCMRRLFETNGFSVIYESVSPHSESAVYLFFVGSRSPERWRDLMPRFSKVTNAGNWIGQRQDSPTPSATLIFSRLREPFDRIRTAVFRKKLQ